MADQKGGMDGSPVRTIPGEATAVNLDKTHFGFFADLRVEKRSSQTRQKRDHIVCLSMRSTLVSSYE